MRFGVMIEKTGPSSAYQYNSLTQRLADWIQELAVKTTAR
jgi:hypothetical protein